MRDSFVKAVMGLLCYVMQVFDAVNDQVFLEWTQRPMPPRTSAMPIHVSVAETSVLQVNQP